MAYDFEDHCWKDVMPAELIELSRRATREVKIGPAPALLAIDLYEQVYRGGNVPLAQAVKECPTACGEFAWNAIAATKQLFAAARAANLPVFYSTNDTAPFSRSADVQPTRSKAASYQLPTDYDIRPEWKPEPGDIVIRKQRASAFYGTALLAHLTQRRIHTLIICGETTSGCVRATAVEGQEHGFHIVVVEECCFDRNIVSHKVNLFDLHHKYADVMHLDEVVEDLGKRALMPAAQ
jgi:nicotinamidase-related amidase